MGVEGGVMDGCGNVPLEDDDGNRIAVGGGVLYRGTVSVVWYGE